MGSLVRTVLSAASAAYGINFFDVAPPAGAVGVQSKYAGIVGDFPWGPQNVVTTCYSMQEVLSAFCPTDFNALATYPAMRAFLNKTFPGPILVNRIAATGALAAVRSYTVTGGTIVGTAAYVGALGNSITATWAAASDAVSTSRNLTIAVGTTYSALYENVTLTTITSLGDRYMTWTKGTSPSVLPAAAVAATTTNAGSDGAAVAGDFVGSASSNVGIRKFYASNVNADVLFVAECPASLIDAVNTGLKAYADEAGKLGIAVACSVASQLASAANTYVGTYRSTQSKLVYAWPRVKTTDAYTSTFPQITVDGNAFLAVATLSVDAWKSPEGSVGAPYLTAISGLETDDSSDSAYAALNVAGISGFFIEDTLGPMIRGAVTTNIVSGQTDIIRSMYRNYLSKQVAAYAIHYVGVPCDVSLTAQTLGENTSGFYAAVKGFLANEQERGRINGYSVDPFGSSTQAEIDAGIWTVAIAVDTFAPLRMMIIKTQIGSTVVIS